jgi:predicted Zn-dependent peptidase
MLKKKIELPEEILARIQQVTAADIQQLAQEIFVDAGLNMAIVGKYKDEAVFKEYFSVEK